MFPSATALGLIIAALVCILGSILIEIFAQNSLEETFWVLSLKTVITFLKEMGFAAFIAYIVIVTVEARAKSEVAISIEQHREEMQTRLDTHLSNIEVLLLDRSSEIQEQGRSYTKQITRNVFNAVLGRVFPEGYASGVIASALDTNIVRLNYYTEFQITRFPEEYCSKYGERMRSKLRLKVKSDYALRNISDKIQKIDLKIAFSQIPEQGLEELAILEGLVIENVKKTPDECEQARADLEDMYYKTYVFPVEIAPRGEIRVHLIYSLVKDLSDSELWTSIYPTMTSEVDVRVEVPGLRFGLRALNREQARLIGGSRQLVGIGDFKWELPSPLLPYQGFVFWWRPQPGEVVPEECEKAQNVP